MWQAETWHSKDIRVPVPRTCKYVPYARETEIKAAGGIKVGKQLTLNSELILVCPGGPSVTRGALKKWKKVGDEVGVMGCIRSTILPLKMDRWGHTPQSAGSLQKVEKGKEVDSPEEEYT